MRARIALGDLVVLTTGSPPMLVVDVCGFVVIAAWKNPETGRVHETGMMFADDFKRVAA